MLSAQPTLSVNLQSVGQSSNKISDLMSSLLSCQAPIMRPVCAGMRGRMTSCRKDGRNDKMKKSTEAQNLAESDTKPPSMQLKKIYGNLLLPLTRLN